jgi:hypothetical protein
MSDRLTRPILISYPGILSWPEIHVSADYSFRLESYTLFSRFRILLLVRTSRSTKFSTTNTAVVLVLNILGGLVDFFRARRARRVPRARAPRARLGKSVVRVVDPTVKNLSK